MTPIYKFTSASTYKGSIASSSSSSSEGEPLAAGAANAGHQETTSSGAANASAAAAAGAANTSSDPPPETTGGGESSPRASGASGASGAFEALAAAAAALAAESAASDKDEEEKEEQQQPDPDPRRPPAELVVVMRCFDGHEMALCARKPDDWRDLMGRLADELGIPVAVLRTFQYWRQTGPRRDSDRAPVGPASWARVEPDATIVMEPPPPPPPGWTVDDEARHVELRDTLPRDTTIIVNRVAEDEIQTFEVNLNWTVSALMMEIEANMNVPQHRQRLVHEARVMQFDEPLRIYNVREGSTVFLLLSC